MLAKRLDNLHPYVPGEQPKDRVYIKLNANENPYPPAKEVGEAVAAAVKSQPEKMGLYPDPDANELRAAIADMINQSGGVLSNKNARIPFTVTPDMIFCGNGSDEVLSFVFYTFFDSDRPIVLPEHTYSFYPVYCGYYGIPMDRVPLKSNWSLDTEKMIADANTSDSATIFANPNAPTGIALSRDEVAAMIRRCPKDKAFIVDEAYCDFGEESCIPLLAEFKNLVIVRTFSKSLSFAGQRLGYIIANPELIQSVFTVKNSFNHFPVDFLTQTAGIASCKNWSYYAENACRVKEERQSMTEFLRARGWFVIDSQTNFIFAKKDGLEGEKVYQTVKKAGILIRHFSTPGIEEFVRISIGTKEQMDSLKEAMKDL
ncbi:histidinol-phosphate transaminase [Treponema sp.]|uniref:histidinol-phosphate transaminase n=1 Tax=Treponema sp. TaxID=166 RepID=UPI0025D569EE|nr:histidinol-phosphate transaminase [Treponema sp.]MCR5217421.1 histidinol-phosphate transaminase [Treponema sp.]